MAQCRLPFSFNISSKLSPGPTRSTIHGTNKGSQPEGDRDPLAPEPRTDRRRMDGANALTRGNFPGNGQNHHPALGTAHEGNSSCSLPLVPLGQQARSTSLNPAHVQAISPLKAYAERPPILTEVNPDSGSVIGGVRIWLQGMYFSALPPLFARFGAAVVPTVSVRFLLSGFTHHVRFARLSLLPTFLPVICLPDPRRVSSISRYRNIPI